MKTLRQIVKETMDYVDGVPECERKNTLEEQLAECQRLDAALTKVYQILEEIDFDGDYDEEEEDDFPSW